MITTSTNPPLNDLQKSGDICYRCGRKVVMKSVFCHYDEHTGEKRYKVFKYCPVNAIARGFFGHYSREYDHNGSEVCDYPY